MATASTPRSSWRTTTTSSLVGFSTFPTFLFLLQPSFSGDYAKTLEKETFTDAKKTTYLEAVKYVANLVWNGEMIILTSFYCNLFSHLWLYPPEYQTKQAHSHPDQSSALVNVDVLDTVLLSLHPKSKLKDLSLSDYTREGLAEIQQFQDLIHMDIHKGYDGYGRRSVDLIFLSSHI